ncbi:MAG: beta galactosidase jelly roll domain-containing protein [Myxococcota bacterium]|nr:beta galactosidase jelly roll domain-containing protein [Myxococcota bacterium]
MRRVFMFGSVVLFLLGAFSLLVSVYMWVGDWPSKTREIVDHYRSVAEYEGFAGPPAIANIYARDIVDLKGDWEAVIDPYGAGDIGGIAARAVEQATPSDLSEFSYRNGLVLEVPGDWNTQDPRLYFYRGVVWYKREFEHRPGDDKRTFIWLGAANYRASVYLNGRLLGQHEGGFTPFNFEMTGSLEPGKNLLVVRVDNEKSDEDVPTTRTDWHNYGGLTRDVLVVDVPRTYIENYSIEWAGPEDGGIRGFVQLAGEGENRAVEISVPELAAVVEVRTGAGGRAEFTLEASPELWSPDNPKLYAVEIASDQDLVRDQIGFRTISVEGDQILLNGSPIFLKGISLHEEAGQGRGRAHDRADAERLLGWAESLGVNFVRLAHYPHSEFMARVADEKGLLVWEEIPVYWNLDFGNPSTLGRARQQLVELIERDRNRASVILWSIGNETPSGEDRQKFMSALAAEVRERDPSRLVTAAMLTSGDAMLDLFGGSYLPALLGLPSGDWEYRIRDPLADLVDVQGLNQYFGWYYSGALGVLGPFSSHHARKVMLDNMHRIRIVSDRPGPIIVSEMGAGAKRGKRAPEEDLVVFSEDYQALVYRRQIKMMEAQSGLVGIAPWILKDFRAPGRLYQGVQDYWNRKGLLSDDGGRKLAFEVLRSWYENMDVESGQLGGAHREKM